MYRFILYTRKGCTLCDRLEQLAEPFLRDALYTGQASLEKRDIDTNEHWQTAYGDRIPVLTCNGEVLLEGKPKQDEIIHAIRQALAA